MDQLKFKQLYKKILIDENMTQTALAQINNISPNSLQQKINHGTIRFIEFVNLMESIGYDVEFKKRED